jgi:hypothetical protein
VRVATYSTSGMFAGQVRMLRKIEGPQQWRVVIKIRTGQQLDEHVISSAGKVDLLDMKDHVISSINELLPPGDTVSAANMDFYCKGKQS